MALEYRKIKWSARSLSQSNTITAIIYFYHRFQERIQGQQIMQLSNKQKQFLKGLAHPLKPVVLLGGNGLTEGVLAEIELALEHHELIKIKVPEEDREMRQAIYDAIVRETAGVQVQVIGKTLVLYRPAREPKMKLPK